MTTQLVYASPSPETTRLANAIRTVYDSCFDPDGPDSDSERLMAVTRMLHRALNPIPHVFRPGTNMPKVCVEMVDGKERRVRCEHPVEDHATEEWMRAHSE